MGVIKRFVVGATLKAAIQVAIKTEVAGKAVDAISPKLNKVTKTMTNEEALQDDFFAYHLIVESMKSRYIEDCYNIFDKYNNLRYIVERTSSNWRHEIHVSNSKHKKIGVIKEQKPFLKEVYEQKERTCDIELNGKYIGQVRTHEMSGERVSFSYNGFSINKNLFGTKTEIFKEDELVGRINHQFATTDSRGVYVISYNNKEDEEAFVLFTIAMDKIDSSGY